MDSIKSAINQLIHNQEKNNIPLNSTLIEIFKITKPVYESLGSEQKAAIETFYKTMADTPCIKRQDWIKPFEIFRAIFPQTFSQASSRTEEQIERSMHSASGNTLEALIRMKNYLEGNTTTLDLRNLNLDSLPSFLFTDPRFESADISNNPIHTLPKGLKIGDLCNIRVYEQAKAIIASRSKLEIPAKILAAIPDFLPLLEENEHWKEAAGICYAEKLKQITADPILSQFIPEFFTKKEIETFINEKPEKRTPASIKTAQACIITTLAERQKSLDENLLRMLHGGILRKLPQPTQQLLKQNLSDNLTKREQADVVEKILLRYSKQCSRIKDLQLVSRSPITELHPLIGLFTELTGLTLYNQRIKFLPQELWTLSKLEELNLAGNVLTSLPSEISNLTKLKFLNLEHNQLRALPQEELASLPDLLSLAITGNPLPPEITTTLQPLMPNCTLIKR